MTAPNQNYNGLNANTLSLGLNYLTGGNPANAIPGLNTLTSLTGLNGLVGKRR